MKIAEVFLNQKNKRIDHAYDYRIPKNLESATKAGMRVVVSFGSGNRWIEGFVILVKEATAYSGKIKEIIENIDMKPVLNKEQIELCLWMKTSYCSLFYEALSYFTTAIKTIQETSYCKSEGDFSLNLSESWFMEHYFKHENVGIPQRSVKKNDQLMLDGLLEKKVIHALKHWKVINENNKAADSTQTIFHLTTIGRAALENDKKIGKNQRILIDYLKHKDMSEGELKMCSAQFEKSLKPLISRAYVTKECVPVKPSKINVLSSDQKNGPLVILSAEEQIIYEDYKKMSRENRGTFFHVFDAVSKYRLFFKAIEDRLKMDQSAVVIFPEVNMTFQRMEMFYKYFGEKIGVFHGRLSQKESADLYRKVQIGQIQVVIGVRSALFLPFKNLGLIIIDDEHDSSHMTIATPKFHITDIARKMSEIKGASYILADDMPRITTWHQIEKKEINLIQIGEKKKSQNKIQVIDMQKEIHNGNMSILSRELLNLIQTALKEDRLSVLFINNKGYANSIFCRNCGHVEKCPHCDVSLKYFNHDQSLHCHYCGYQEPIPVRCPVCSSDKIRHMGFGIDQLIEIIRKLWPSARIATVQGNMNRSEIKKTNKALSGGKIDILIGTHVIIKHFNLVNVGIAAAVLIDRDLNQGDYRAAETVYQTYGRFFEKAMGSETKGLIQTNEPENETIYSITSEEFHEFYRGEIHYRELMKYPPIVNMINFGVFQKNEQEVENDAFHLYVALKEQFKNSGMSYAIYKPIRVGITIGGNVNYQIILKLSDLSVFHQVMPKIINMGTIEKLKSKVSIQINP